MHNIIVWIALSTLFIMGEANSLCMKNQDATLRWKDREYPLREGLWVLIKIGENKESSGYVLYPYQPWLDSMIWREGGCWVVVPQNGVNQ